MIDKGHSTTAKFYRRKHILMVEYTDKRSHMAILDEHYQNCSMIDLMADWLCEHSAFGPNMEGTDELTEALYRAEKVDAQNEILHYELKETRKWTRHLSNTLSIISGQAEHVSCTASKVNQWLVDAGVEESQ